MEARGSSSQQRSAAGLIFIHTIFVLFFVFTSPFFALCERERAKAWGDSSMAGEILLPAHTVHSNQTLPSAIACLQTTTLALPVCGEITSLWPASPLLRVVVCPFSVSFTVNCVPLGSFHTVCKMILNFDCKVWGLWTAFLSYYLYFLPSRYH